MKKMGKLEKEKEKQIQNVANLARMKSAEDLSKKQIQESGNTKMMKLSIESLKKQLQLKQFQLNQAKVCSNRKGELIKELTLTILYLKRENQHLKNDIRALKQKLYRYQLQPQRDQERVSILTNQCHVPTFRGSQKFSGRTSSEKSSVKQSNLTSSRTINQSMENYKNQIVKISEMMDDQEQRRINMIKQLRENMKYLKEQNNFDVFSMESLSNIECMEYIYQQKQLKQKSCMKQQSNKINVKNQNQYSSNYCQNSDKKLIQKEQTKTKQKLKIHQNQSLKKLDTDTNTIKQKQPKQVNNKISRKQKEQILAKQFAQDKIPKSVIVTPKNSQMNTKINKKFTNNLLNAVF